jgi:hypothetical protein
MSRSRHAISSRVGAGPGVALRAPGRCRCRQEAPMNFRFGRLLVPVTVAALLSSVGCSGDSGGEDSAQCRSLADKCPYCSDASLKATCESAVKSGDSASCQDGLDDPDIQSMCKTPGGGGGSTGSGGSPGSGGTPGTGGSPQVGPCAELAQKCPHCSEPSLKLTCNSAVATGDPASCQDGLDDIDIQTKCN